MVAVQKFDNEKSGEDQSKVEVKVFHGEAEQQFGERQREEIITLTQIVQRGSNSTNEKQICLCLTIDAVPHIAIFYLHQAKQPITFSCLGFLEPFIGLTFNYQTQSHSLFFFFLLNNPMTIMHQDKFFHNSIQIKSILLNFFF